MINDDESGTLREDSYFKDRSSSYRTVTFRSDHSGEFAKQLRDGTVVSGTFDSADYHLSPDQTGEGILTTDNIIYKINFNRY